MKISGLASAFAVAVLFSPVNVMAKADCHGSMKDMLQGTLDVAGEAKNKQDAEESTGGCTLAALEGKPTSWASL